MEAFLARLVLGILDMTNEEEIPQAIERVGDHAKNLAEEICHLVSGRSVRHILRDYDRPVEQVYLERMRRSRPEK